MTLLAVVAPRVVCITDIIGVGRGADHLWITGCIPGWWNTESAARSDSRGIHVERSPHGTGTVRWTEVRALIRSGITPELVERATAAHAAYARAPFADHAVIDEMRAIEVEVIRRGLSVVAPEQGALFEVAS